MSQKLHFSREEDDKLTEKVRKHRGLYDLKHQQYKDARVKDNIWKEIAQHVGRPKKSDHYYLRKERMKNVQAPIISEAKRELGEDLAYALLESCPDPLKRVMGMSPLLKGAGNDLWISPSDVLIGKVCLKPPLTDRHMKALTHQGILLIGHDIEIKFWNQAQLEKAKVLFEQEEMLTFIGELEKRKAVAAACKKEQEQCQKEKELMQLVFEATLKDELEELEKKLTAEYELLIIRQKEQLNNDWQLKLEAAVAESVAKLTERFLTDLEEQEKELFRKFSIEIKKEQVKRRMDVKHAEECCQETFLQLKHQLECKNIANMMYILCIERRKCQAERELVETEYERHMQELQNQLVEKEIEIRQLTKDFDNKSKQVNLREECLLEILRQFQKFINFALRATPTQAEFLLSVEKMMVFELTQAVRKTDKKHAKRLTKTLLPWKDKSDTTTTSLSCKRSLESLRASDYHECYNEKDTPVDSERSYVSADYLPAFHYDKHMYVREEFRNMMSQGIKLTPSSLIWNKDVEHLMQVLRRSVTSLKEQQEADEEEKLNEKREDEREELKEKQVEIKEELALERGHSSSDGSSYKQDRPPADYRRQPRRSTVYFKNSKTEGDFLFPIFESDSLVLKTTPDELYNEIAVQISDADSAEGVDPDMIIDKECCKPCYVGRPSQQPFQRQTFQERESAVPLIGTVNSVELVKEAESVPAHDHEPATGLLCAQDSLHKHRMSLKPTNMFLSERVSVDISEVINLRKKSGDKSVGSKASSYRNTTNISDISVEDKNSLRRISRDSKIHFRLDNRPPAEHKSDKAVEHRNTTDKEFLTVSKLSLARDSFIVHKQSLILKRASSVNPQAAQPGPKQIPSPETLQLKKLNKPGSTVDISDRSSLKKSSKTCVSNTSSYSIPCKTPSDESTRSPVELRFPTSKLTMSRDSLDLLRLDPKLSLANQGKRRLEARESEIEIRDGILGAHLDGRGSSPPIIKLDDDGSRTVKMSHIEILPFDDYHLRVSTEMVEDEQLGIRSVLQTEDLPLIDSPWLIYDNKESDVCTPEPPPPPQRDNFLTKPNVVHVCGDQKATEHIQKDKEFTLHRASSLLSIFSKHPSLVKMFTSVTK